MIEALGLTKSYGERRALDALTLKIDAGEIFCLLGANGAGKTTTINLLLGFSAPTSGTARVCGVDVTHAPAEARRHIAYVPETVMLYRHLSGLENLEFFAKLSRTGATDRRSLAASLKRVGLSAAAADQRASSYSKGMRQKVGVAVALARKARVLILDEPLSGLDPLAANELSRLIRELGESGMAVLMATHDIFRAKETGHRVGIMREGKLVRELATQDIEHQDLDRIYLTTMGAAA